jgi:hypothetical protein
MEEFSLKKEGIMKMIVSLATVCFAISSPSAGSAATLFYDNFSGNAFDSSKWHFAYWGGQVLGRTLFRSTSFPEVKNGNAIIAVDSYNPEDVSYFSFYGNDVMSNKLIPLTGRAIHVKFRAKMDTSTPGIVCGIFLFAFRSGTSGLHDEIDFEFVTSVPNAIMTNSYSNEPLGAGHPEFTYYDSGTVTDYHTYEIKWETDKVSWFVDGRLVREDTDHVPVIPMEIHLNAWVADSGWPQAYNAELQPAASAASNQSFGMSVDSVEVQGPKIDLSPVLHLLL